ncbi:hypothetical protein NADFUDRAFT_51623 [Nadsonia fulvescens var. elongata DSM 6958]|uniref:Phosphotransferase n=1 Tax=Nadsonia fulvescens var. elongata DSM 6958 TaxID=857566 RepID=A0A1E3PIJ3_9ASCO|nr:hypothetical protein NADFUDRAFT_51623 [Nadsonia fulvescens var. elongata DSM 6958]
MDLPQSHRPHIRKGSFKNVPPELGSVIKELDSLFTVETTKLKSITDHFVSELQKGLSVTGGSIPMNPTWILDKPTGSEIGNYLALDLGGTNLRVVHVILDGNRHWDCIQSKYKLPATLKTDTSEKLWAFIAECLEKFLRDNRELLLADKYNGPELVQRRADNSNPSVHLGFTFSYPVTQKAIDHGVLQRWTKGFSIDGVEGQDVVPLLNKALQERKLPIELCAVINDTTGTLVASNYTDPRTKMGLIFGTGCNAAYYERLDNIPKLAHKLPEDVDLNTLMAINCEWGAFDNEHKVLPRTKWDEQLDRESPRQGEQTFEKMIAGYYLGEILRLVLIDLASQNKIFEGQPLDRLQKPYIMDSSCLSKIESDPWENLSEVETLFEEKLSIKTTDPERQVIRRLTEMIGLRSARLSHCGVAAIFKKAKMTSCQAGADGSVVNLYPHFKQRGAQALKEIFDWNNDLPMEEYPIQLVPAEDGSGIGAAIIAALTHTRLKKGLFVGSKEHTDQPN